MDSWIKNCTIEGLEMLQWQLVVKNVNSRILRRQKEDGKFGRGRSWGIQNTYKPITNCFKHILKAGM